MNRKVYLFIDLIDVVNIWMTLILWVFLFKNFQLSNCNKINTWKHVSSMKSQNFIGTSIFHTIDSL
jgi:hypothetical protein